MYSFDRRNPQMLKCAIQYNCIVCFVLLHTNLLLNTRFINRSYLFISTISFFKNFFYYFASKQKFFSYLFVEKWSLFSLWTQICLSFFSDQLYFMKIWFVAIVKSNMRKYLYNLFEMESFHEIIIQSKIEDMILETYRWYMLRKCHCARSKDTII